MPAFLAARTWEDAFDGREGEVERRVVVVGLRREGSRSREGEAARRAAREWKDTSVKI